MDRRGDDGDLSDSADLQDRSKGNGDDDFDDFDESYGNDQFRENNKGAELKSQVVSNQPFDETVELSDEDEEPQQGGAAPSEQPAADGDGQVVQNQPFDEAVELSSEESVDDADEGSSQQIDTGGPAPVASAHEDSSGGEFGKKQQQGGGGSESSSEEDEAAEAQDTAAAGDGKGTNYNPADYAHLQVSADIKELFQYIGRYKPHPIELETKMKPFIPDYIPAVGDIDPFVKIPRPDGKPDTLGLQVLDEPSSQQSDPTVMQLQLRSVSKQSNLQPMLVRSVELADKNPTAVNGWIQSINDLHRNKPPPTVQYSKQMPEIETLMQIWPAQVEDMLENCKLPSADLDMDLKDYVKVVCAMLDIPVYNGCVEPLHVLFTLFSEFKTNVHFQQQFTEQPESGTSQELPPTQ